MSANLPPPNSLTWMGMETSTWLSAKKTARSLCLSAPRWARGPSTSPPSTEKTGATSLVDNLLGINGYSVPALTPTSEGLRVFVANETGTVQDFGLASDNWDDALLLEVDDAVFGGREGFRCAAATRGLWTTMGCSMHFVGIQNGGLLAYSSSTDTVIVGAAALPAWEWQVMPNPGRDAFRWRSAQPWSGELTAWSVTGKASRSRRRPRSNAKAPWRRPNWAPGTYIIRPMAHPWKQQGRSRSGTPLTWIKLPE